MPIYGRIASLELFRPPVSKISNCSFGCLHYGAPKQQIAFANDLQGEKKDLLFFTTERYKFCVLYWDAESKCDCGQTVYFA